MTFSLSWHSYVAWVSATYTLKFHSPSPQHQPLVGPGQLLVPGFVLQGLGGLVVHSYVDALLLTRGVSTIVYILDYVLKIIDWASVLLFVCLCLFLFVCLLPCCCVGSRLFWRIISFLICTTLHVRLIFSHVAHDCSKVVQAHDCFKK